MSESAPLTALHDGYGHLRVAIVHDWLVVQGGAEKVLDALLEAFPQAELFTLVDFLPAEQRGRIARHRVQTSLIQRLPLARHRYRHYLPWMPYAIEQFDLSDFDLVISSSHAVAKGVLTHPGQRHYCYCHTPMRYAWDMKEAYLRDANFPAPIEWAVRRSLKRLRQWDHFTASQVDHFIANSANVAGRIAKFYRRDATVIHPPVDLPRDLAPDAPREDFYLAASRLVPYKRIDLIIEAFKRDGRRQLKVVGDGPERKRLAQLAAGANNIQLLGYQPDAVLSDLMSRTRAFVFAADEDFGILPLEAQAHGAPVIAYGHGGALETVRGIESAEQATGLFFDVQTADSLLSAIERFELLTFSPAALHQQVQRFTRTHFWQALYQVLASPDAMTEPLS